MGDLVCNSPGVSCGVFHIMFLASRDIGWLFGIEYIRRDGALARAHMGEGGGCHQHAWPSIRRPSYNDAPVEKTQNLFLAFGARMKFRARMN